jgi:hypothetical protein
MIKLSIIRRGASPRDGAQKSAAPILKDAGSPGRPPESPLDRLPLTSLGRFLLAHWRPEVANVNGEKRLIWRELWNAHLYPAEYYGPKK